MTYRIKMAAAALIFLFLCVCSYGMALQQQLDAQVIRLHILANSNDPEDQQLKLLVRDEVLRHSQEWFGGEDITTARQSILQNKEEITAVCQQVLREQGCQDEVTVEVRDTYIETRSYGSFALPAGVYQALRIEIGKAEGKNWWCVMYPPLCVASATQDTVDICRQYGEGENNIALITGSGDQGVEWKFKLVELYSQGSHWLSELLGRQED